METSLVLSPVMDRHRNMQIIWRAGNPKNNLFAFAMYLVSVLFFFLRISLPS